jgi:hypothetical protein
MNEILHDDALIVLKAFPITATRRNNAGVAVVNGGQMLCKTTKEIQFGRWVSLTADMNRPSIHNAN